MKVLLTLIAFLLILLLAILIGAQNNQVILVNYLIAQSEMELSSLMAITLLVGVVLSLSVFSVFWFRLRWRIRRLERLVKKSSQPEKT